MKINWIPLPEPWHDRVVLYAICLFAVLLPFQLIFPPITAGIVCVMLAVVLRFRPKENAFYLKANSYYLPWIGLFALLLIGLFYTTDLKEAGRDITLKISLLLFPIAFAALPKINKTHFQIAIKAFVFALVLADIVALLLAAMDWFQTRDIGAFFYDRLTFSRMVSIHHFSLYNSFGAALVLSNIFGKGLHFGAKKVGIQWFFFALFTLIVVLLAVRIQFIALLLAIILVFVYHQKNFFQYRTTAIGAGLGFLLIMGSALFFEGPQKRIQETLDEWNSLIGEGAGKQTNPRYFLWREAGHVIANSFWMGRGTGAADAALQERIEHVEAYFWVGDRNVLLSEFRFNYHNEFLQHFATHGIVGFLLLMSLFIGPLFKKNTIKNPIIGLFLLLSFLSFLTESMLERQAGVLFFGFFYGFLVINSQNTSEPVVDH